MAKNTVSYTGQRKEPFFVYDFTALDERGESVWYFMAIPQLRSADFELAISQTNVIVDIRKYGKILAFGKGESAPESMRTTIMKLYAIDE